MGDRHARHDDALEMVTDEAEAASGPWVIKGTRDAELGPKEALLPRMALEVDSKRSSPRRWSPLEELLLEVCRSDRTGVKSAVVCNGIGAPVARWLNHLTYQGNEINYRNGAIKKAAHQAAFRHSKR